MTQHRVRLDQQWTRRAACAGQELAWFFPTTDAEAEIGLTICAGCEVRDECLEHALAANETEGIWGGQLPDARVRIRRARYRARANIPRP